MRYTVHLQETYHVEADSENEAVDRAVAASHGGRIEGTYKVDHSHDAWELRET